MLGVKCVLGGKCVLGVKCVLGGKCVLGVTGGLYRNHQNLNTFELS